VRELVAYARDNPGKVNLAIPGVGTQPHLIGEMFKQRTGVSIVTVPYKGSAAVTDLVAGRVQMYFGPAQDLLAFFSTGKLRPLAVLSATRRAELPDVPTMAEAGYDGFDVSLWVGIVAPAGTPASIVARLNAAVNAGLASAEVRAHLDELQADARPGTPEDFADFIAAEARKWTDVAKTAGIVIN
jgi:tripartite-type tricarboxylate transporter receptor subunit TctC